MEGIVLHYDVSSKQGIMRDAEGVRYEFFERDWMSESNPSPGMRADFKVVGNSAIQIYNLPQSDIETISKETVNANELKWPDHLLATTNPSLITQSKDQASTLSEKPKPVRSSRSGFLNWLGIIATLTVAVTLFSPVMISEWHGGFSPFSYIAEGSSWEEWRELWMVPVLGLILICFYAGGRKLIIRIFVALAIGGIAFTFFNAFSEFYMSPLGTPMPVSLTEYAYVNFVACTIMFLVAYSRYYSPRGVIGRGTAVVKGQIETIGSYRDLGGRWFKYSYITLLDYTGKRYNAKRVLVSDDIDPLVSPGVNGIFIFTRQFFSTVCSGIKTDNQEVYYLPNSIIEMFKYLIATGFFGLMTYGTFISVILIPISPFLAFMTVASVFGFFNVPFRIRHLRRTFRENKFNLTRINRI